MENDSEQGSEELLPLRLPKMQWPIRRLTAVGNLMICFRISVFFCRSRTWCPQGVSSEPRPKNKQMDHILLKL